MSKSDVASNNKEVTAVKEVNQTQAQLVSSKHAACKVAESSSQGVESLGLAHLNLEVDFIILFYWINLKLLIKIAIFNPII